MCRPNAGMDVSCQLPLFASDTSPHHPPRWELRIHVESFSTAFHAGNSTH